MGKIKGSAQRRNCWPGVPIQTDGHYPPILVEVIRTRKEHTICSCVLPQLSPPLTIPFFTLAHLRFPCVPCRQRQLFLRPAAISLPLKTPHRVEARLIYHVIIYCSSFWAEGMRRTAGMVLAQKSRLGSYCAVWDSTLGQDDNISLKIYCYHCYPQ